METIEAQDEAMREYEKTLILPEQPRRKHFILCPAGLVGAGKTTVTKPLAEKLSLVRISGDEIRKTLKEHGLSYDGLIRIGAELMKKYLAKGYSTALDSDAMSPRSKEVIDNAEQEFGAMPVWIHVNPPEEFILNKLRTYNHTWLFKDGDEAVANYMRRKNLHENLDSIPFVYTFDTSRDDLGNQIDEATELIKSLVALP
jgi:predicted kinase